ncbi:MAG: hypothetical protein ACRECT_03790 [Thermoplasmata archaeon]
MTEPEVVAADGILRRHGVRYVVVGGQAIARSAATTTQDVDVMVATDDYVTTLARLRGDPSLAFDWEDAKLARFRILPIGGVPLDILNAATFAGERTASEFFRFLVGDATADADGIAYASPELVWYTRLLTKRWRAYAEKIVTNIIDGLAPGRLEKVEEIARRFGTDATLRDRIAYVRQELARPEVDSLVRRE